MGRKKREDNYWDSDKVDADAELLTAPKETPKTQPIKEAPTTIGGPTTLGGVTTIGGSSAPAQAKKKKQRKKGDKKVDEDETENIATVDIKPKVEEKKQVKEEIKEVSNAESPQNGQEKKKGDATDLEAPEENQTAEDDGEEDDGKKKKKKGKKKAAVEKEPKRKGLSKKMQEQILKLKEEEERIQREAEEKRKREEEEELKRQQEEAEKEAIRLAKKEKKKQKLKEKQKSAVSKAHQQKLELLRQQFQGTTTTHGEQQTPQEEKEKKVVYLKKKKPGKKTEDEQPDVSSVQPEATSETTKEEGVLEQQEESKEMKEEEEDDWETKENWEDEEEKPKPKPKVEEKPKQEEKSKVEIKPSPKQQVEKTEEEKAEDGSLRSPICCVLGHVDTGKTKLLDKIRKSNVQEGEFGGITQQIGATFFPMQTICEQTAKLPEASKLSVKVPGLLIIDTPGHESFTNLRSRGSSLCDIAILVVDIMHGLEPQTIESINLLKMRKTPFIVALNKVDRIFGWKTCPNSPIKKALERQEQSVMLEYEKLVKNTITYFAEQSLNACLYYENKDFRKYVSLVPTSAISGEGIPDLLMLLVQLTQKLMSEQLLYVSQLQCTVLEVKVVEGLGTTIDAILVNGVLHEGDEIVLCGMNGPIVTSIRALLTPQPLKEMRVKGTYIHHKKIQASQGVKICGQDLDKAVAGSSLLVVGPNDNVEDLKKEVMQDLESMRSKVDKTGHGVYVQASTLGSLEALLDFLTNMKIPVSGVNIGPINKKDVMRASVMLEHEDAKQYAVILAFDVKESKEARDLADEMGVKIFKAQIIYHLFDQFTLYMEEVASRIRQETSSEAVFPSRLRIYEEHIFNKKDPIVLGVEVVEGTLKIGTPIVVPSKEFIYLGRITSIQVNHKDVQEAKKGLSVAIKIEMEDPGAQSKVYGRHFDYQDELVSRISRQTIDVLKQSYSKELSKEDIILLQKLKAVFGIK